MLLPGLLNGKWHGLEGLVHLVVYVRHLGQHRARVPPAPGHLLAACKKYWSNLALKFLCHLSLQNYFLQQMQMQP